ncbi:hypothetical protein J2S00_002491 [Caldalkalibacillus uzonensis]|uniref:HTH luxR-type domain-containing protein n=1 Tax=Caldalkalibacillus uzonensis TaxID=353224 RepID=A0ABU0CTF4_9BACI|nr:hypothetical protein [Caldalkalibacillus uzonensis]MDQ0339698.1 hypothetical protein [Caldalkalibacillus uzonensis]
MLERNQDIRQLKKGIPNWLIAERLGIHENTFIRKLRKELPKEEKLKILAVIDELKQELGRD